MESREQYDNRSPRPSGTMTDGVGKAAQDSMYAAKEFFTPKDGVVRGERSEGSLTKQIESVTTKVPSATFLTCAFGVMGASALLHLAGKRHDAIFVGQWVPAILIMGLYNKLVKLEGSERRA